jgi:hypothetical protein
MVQEVLPAVDDRPSSFVDVEGDADDAYDVLMEYD